MTSRNQNCKIILASGSPRRRELMERMGLSFDVMPVDLDETLDPGISLRDAVAKLARDKALAAAERLESCAIVAADTLVECGGKILGKPGSEQEAYDMIRLLSDNWHSVMTGVCVVHGRAIMDACETTLVHFTKMSEQEIKWYISTGESMDKAGAYGIQGYAGAFIDSIRGDYFNVMGLPMAALLHLLKSCGVV